MIESAIGNTPIVTLSNIIEPGRVFIKLEKNNPAGSVKDRPAYFMIKDAEIKGQLGDHQKIIVEPTSGNTGIALAAIARSKGYKIYLTMPESMSVERRQILKLLGAELILTPADKGMKGAIEKAEELQKKYNAFMPNQFDNPSNPKAHEYTTGPEILKQMDFNVDAFVAGVGTGGTITGVGKVLRKTFQECIKIFPVEPANSSVISGNQPGKHKIQGIGAGFIPGNLELSLLDEPIKITDEEAYEMTKRLAKEEGLFLGISSGANVAAAIKAADILGENKRIVTIGCDSGDKYISLLGE
ncbi:cysteine synthase A [Geotoga petraea]|jgi:cysteine synthase A|uniref:Cysteine synthase n=1 Tax=Geotoga petraea TaxID=28234 RepID=A0A1G6JDE0_9BACT|nr:cysteine synthase A [Geotoga petraea]MDK2946118.1 cysteine synthase [Geotoga sp.]TGG88191.1 cysteine synthase A [Geotoga petraea]SDC16689.1 cysteine synthase [Geotoga petraea]